MSFYITLPSNITGNKLFEHNTLANYMSKLATCLNLSNEYEVGLAEMSYTKSWFNVQTDQKICVIDGSGGIHCSGITLKAGRYDDQVNLVTLINKTLNTYRDEEIIIPPQLEMNQNTRRVSMIAGKDVHQGNCYALLDPELQNMLGFGDEYFDQQYAYTTVVAVDVPHVHVLQKDIKGSFDAYNAYDMNAGIHSLYIYCDIIEPSFVGDTYAQLLRVVEIPHHIPFGEQCVITYQKPHYFSLNSRLFDTIEIDIKDDTGAPIKFQFGRSLVTLHFRKKNGRF
jgi:hypothetical protein